MTKHSVSSLFTLLLCAVLLGLILGSNVNSASFSNQGDRIIHLLELIESNTRTK